MMLAPGSLAPVVNVYNAASSLNPAFWTMIGALSTAVIGATALLLNEWRRRKHERSLRLFDVEREACGQILRHTADVINHRHRGDFGEASRALDDSYPALSNLQLLSNGDVVTTAKNLLGATIWWLAVASTGVAEKEVDGHTVVVTGDDAQVILSQQEKDALAWYSYTRRLYNNSVRKRFELQPFPIPAGSVVAMPKGVNSVFDEKLS